MCGIAVAVNWEDAQTAVRQMAHALRHRGDVTDPIVEPWKNAAMCTRRLRIVDAAHGEQPQASFDGQILVSFNGEIYNHKQLRRELEQLGIAFRTNCDTEVLANALRAWGATALTRLAGMFAFVALDMRNGEFLAARDPFGVKPLYLIQSGTRFLFCSEIRPLLEAAPEGEVLLLPPGYLLTTKICTRFYALPTPVAEHDSSPDILDRLLDQAVLSRLPEDVPATSLFSGGIDSTLLVHYARRHRPDMPAYFIGSPDAPDSAFALRYADMTGLDLRTMQFELRKGEPLALLESVVGALECFEPAAVRPGLYTYLLSERIHQDGFRVALCGEGADELFAGYEPLEQAFAQNGAAGRFLQEQCLGMMHRANLQRLDRCAMRFALEIREPFLDIGLADYAMHLGPAALLKAVDGQVRGKQPLRDIYDLYPAQLPAVIRDRRKTGFDVGAGLGLDCADWLGLFEDAISDAEFAEGRHAFTAFELGSKEELFYLRLLAKHMDISRVPHLKGRLRLDMPPDTVAKPQDPPKRVHAAS